VRPEGLRALRAPALALAALAVLRAAAAAGQEPALSPGSSTEPIPELHLVEAPRAGIDPAAARPVASRAELDLIVNGEPRGPALVLLVGGDAWVEPRVLAAAGLTVPEGLRAEMAGASRVSLRSLAPAIAFEVDERALALRLTAAIETLGRRTLDLRAAPPPAGLLARSDPSAFLDYAVEGRWPGQPSADFELGTSGGGWLLLGAASRLEGGEWARGLVSLTRDEPEEMRRWVAGDMASATGPLGGTVLLGGLGVQRELSLDPYGIHAPLPRGSAVATSPSTLEVYVNGTLVRRERLAPGTYDLQNLPATSGAGVVQAVLRDAFGRTQELDARYYFSSGLLAEGLDDYGYQLGLARRGLGERSFDYGEPVLLARHRLGFTDRLTAGLRGEASSRAVSGGPGLTAAMPFGELDLAAGASGAAGRAGAAGQVAWSFVAWRSSVGARVEARSPRYATASLLPEQDRPALSLEAFAGTALARAVSLEAVARLSRWRDAGEAGSIGGRVSIGLGLGAALFLSAEVGRQPGGASGATLLALLSWSAGPRSSAELSAGRSAAGSSQAGVGAQRTLPPGEGLGYRLRAEGGGPGPSSLVALGQAQRPQGLVEAEWDQAGGVTAGRLRAAGALVLIDGRLFASRPVDSSYALVQVPGVEGVRGSLENQEVGRTDRDGDLLVPSLLPYHANRLSIRGEDVPMEYDLGSLEQLVAPPLRGGAVARFAVHRFEAVSGALWLPGAGRVRPANGEMAVVVGGERRVSPVASDGRFWLDGLPPGRHRAVVDWRGGSCAAELDLPPGAGAIADLGEVECRPEPEVSASR
jgi:outer membrane usher protein